MTVKDLKEMLEGLEDDREIVVGSRSSNSVVSLNVDFENTTVSYSGWSEKCYLLNGVVF